MARQSGPNRAARRALGALEQSFEIAAASRLTVQQTSGPLPSPEILRQYNDAHPGLADRIVVMAEQESVHRREMEKTIVSAQAIDIRSQRNEIRIGQFCALAVAMCGFGFGSYAMTHGAQIGGSILSGGTLCSLVGAFLYRQHAAAKRPTPTAKPAEQGTPKQSDLAKA